MQCKVLREAACCELHAPCCMHASDGDAAHADGDGMMKQDSLK